MTDEPVLAMAEVTCRFADGGRAVTALDRVDLTVGAGEMVAVMGPSGSGKSTLVHVACGLVTPTGGAVTVLGRAPEPRRARRWWADMRRRHIGVVHQRLNLVPGMDALANVALPLRLAGTGERRAREAARAALAEAGVAEAAPVRAERLSVGEQQRVALARAIVGDRRLVLADEATAALDTVGAEAIAGTLADLARAGRAVLLVTHDSRLASWADRAVILRDGCVVDRVGAAT
ncbi:MAG TPA: ATP-binding cassette domain-containing protein [Acidimicrobiales bacterium]|nr:ATP-binding cassette domain-containing protein [Acidimicrobiales bacterium]